VTDEELDAALDGLYAVPPAGFVAERDRIVKALKAAGRRDDAADVTRLARPSPAAWALNQVARTDPGAVCAWMDAASDLRGATKDPAAAGGEGIRGAMAAHREATGRLTSLAAARAEEHGIPLSPANADRVRTLLQEASADAEAAAWVRGGRLTGAPAPATGAPPSPPSPARKPKGPDPADVARAARRAELELRVAELSADVERRQAERDQLDAAAATAAERLEAARRGLRRAESEAAAARGALSDAEFAAVEAERELEQLRAVLHRDG
jgi:hypothetical protein